MEHHLLAERRCVAGRLEVLEGPTGRRQWPDEVKARIVAESFEPGARVAEVARRHGLKPQHLSTWRCLARQGRLVLPADDGSVFAALELEEPPAPASAEPIEIEAGGVTVRLPGASSAARIAEVVAALRAAP